MATVVKLKCVECGKSFLYVKKFNQYRKFCDLCQKLRIAESKIRFKKVQKERPHKKQPDDMSPEVVALLDKIPDRVVSVDGYFNAILKVAQ